MVTTTDIGNGWNPIGGVQDLINGAAGAISYWSDPWGNTFKALKDAAAGLSRDVLPALTQATLPNLNAQWFLNAYAVSFAAAIFVAVLLLIPQILRTARGTQAGRDLVDSVGLYFGVFLVGAMFGPAIGIVLVNFFHAISNDIVAWGVQSSIDGVITQFQKMIANADPVGITGGVPIAVLLMLCMLLGLFLVLMMLIVQLVTLYFTGVLLPLGLVWIIDPGKRTFGTKLVSVWIGILAAHPLLFFLLGFAFTIMANSVSTFGNNASLQSLVTLSVAVIALFVAALSPLLLMKFAPVIPSGFGGTSGPALSTNSIGARNMSDAGRRFDRGNGQPKGNTSGSGSGTSDAGAAVGGERTLAGVSAARAGATSRTAGAGAAGAGAGGGAAAATTAAATSAAATTSAATTTTAAEGLAAAGAAESSTGVGAAIGIPTLVVAAGAMAATQGLKVTEKAGQHAVAAMDDSTIGSDRTS
jgi:type IV secretion system protein TrbL